MEAAREELVPRVEAGQLGVVHEDVLLSEAEAICICIYIYYIYMAGSHCTIG